MKRLDGTLDRRLKANRAGYGRGAGAAAGASAEAGGGRGQTVREGDGGGGGRLPTPVLYPSLPWQTSDATRTPSTPTNECSGSRIRWACSRIRLGGWAASSPALPAAVRTQRPCGVTSIVQLRQEVEDPYAEENEEMERRQKQYEKLISGKHS